MQDRSQVEGEKDKKNTGEEMQGMNTTGQAKIEQRKQKQLSRNRKKKDRQNTSNKRILKSKEKEGKKERNKKKLLIPQYTDSQPQKGYKNQQIKTRIEKQN